MRIDKKTCQGTLQPGAQAEIQSANRVLAIFVARWKSRIPAPSAISQCGRGVKLNFGGAPQRRTSTFAEASCPTGTELCGTLGTVSINSEKFCIQDGGAFVGEFNFVRNAFHFRQ